MVRNRSTRGIIAAVALVLWLGYMAVGLAVIDTMAPTVGGEGPQGRAAYVGLLYGVVPDGLSKRAASDRPSRSRRADIWGSHAPGALLLCLPDRYFDHRGATTPAHAPGRLIFRRRLSPGGAFIERLR